MGFQVEALNIPDIKHIHTNAFVDDRGFFSEMYRQSALTASGMAATFVQINHSRSARGVVRGLHFQREPCAQAKLVYVARGEIFDVGVDLRSGSPWYGTWAGTTLSAAQHNMLFIPEGFAHGFCALTDDTDVIYLCSADYAPEHDAGVRWDDPDLDIPWPEKHPRLSAKDASLPAFRQIETSFEYQA